MGAARVPHANSGGSGGVKPGMAIIRFTGLFLALVVGVLGVGRVLGLMSQEQFMDWALRGGAAVLIVGAIAFVIKTVSGGAKTT